MEVQAKRDSIKTEIVLAQIQINNGIIHGGVGVHGLMSLLSSYRLHFPRNEIQIA